jgi:hypothetical protein
MLYGISNKFGLAVLKVADKVAQLYDGANSAFRWKTIFIDRVQFFFHVIISLHNFFFVYSLLRLSFIHLFFLRFLDNTRFKLTSRGSKVRCSKMELFGNCCRIVREPGEQNTRPF